MTQSKMDVFISSVEKYFDEIVDCGSDQELFTASYLQGHFAVAVGQCQIDNIFDLDGLAAIVEKSLDEAFYNNELDIEDRQQVRLLWRHFMAKYVS